MCLSYFISGFPQFFGILTTCYFVANFTTVFTGFLLFRWVKPHPVLVTTDIIWSWWWIFLAVRILFVENIWSRNFTFLFLEGIECRFAFNLFNMSNSRFLNSFRVTFNGYYLLAILSQILMVRLCSFSCLVNIRRLISASSAETRPCAKIRHLKSSAVKSANLKSLQCLFTVAAIVK